MLTYYTLDYFTSLIWNFLENAMVFMILVSVIKVTFNFVFSLILSFKTKI